MHVCFPGASPGFSGDPAVIPEERGMSVSPKTTPTDTDTDLSIWESAQGETGPNRGQEPEEMLRQLMESPVLPGGTDAEHPCKRTLTRSSGEHEAETAERWLS